MKLTPELRFEHDGVELARYVYDADDPQRESPRPYFHPIRTLDGNVVSVYRPWDHVWHKGISLAPANVGVDNFWGGPTYVRDEGYVQLPNNGRQRHDSFTSFGSDGFTEQLTWITQQRVSVLSETREVALSVLPELDAWVLRWETTLTNLTPRVIPFGSPTTEGRPNAGYSGIFWRGPRSFTGGRVIASDGQEGQDVMGSRFPWLAYVGKHDEVDASSTLVFVDRSGAGEPVQWFVRSDPYGCVCPAPFFDVPVSLDPGGQLALRCDVVIGSGAWDHSQISSAAATL